MSAASTVFSLTNRASASSLFERPSATSSGLTRAELFVRGGRAARAERAQLAAGMKVKCELGSRHSEPGRYVHCRAGSELGGPLRVARADEGRADAAR